MIYGTPAIGLRHGGFGTADSRAAGAAGEKLTAAILNGFADRAAIFHDLVVPHNRLTINIDHAVLSGKNLLLIDSKLWKAGRHWSLGPWYFHGTDRGRPPSQAVAIAHDSFRAQFAGLYVPTPMVVLWSGAQARARLIGNQHGQPLGVAVDSTRVARPFIHYNYPGARTITGNALHGRVNSFITRKAPDPVAVQGLTRLLNR